MSLIYLYEFEHLKSSYTSAAIEAVKLYCKLQMILLNTAKISRFQNFPDFFTSPSILKKNSSQLSQISLQILFYSYYTNTHLYFTIIQQKYYQMAMANTLQHLKDIKKFNSMIEEHQQKLDQKVNEAINHMMNYSFKINDLVLPEIQNKKVAASSKYFDSFHSSKRNIRARSVGTRSFLQKSTIINSNDLTMADSLLETYKHKNIRKQIKDSEQVPQKQGSRPIGSQKYAKPRFIKRAPDILPKQIRLNPFSEKNAIRANQLQKGMLHLVQTGKVGKNIDIITAFQKGRPVLQTHQAIVHQAQEKYAYAQIQKANEKQKRVRPLISMKNQKDKIGYSQTIKIENEQFIVEDLQPSWALTMPENTQSYIDTKNITKKSKKPNIEDLEDFHYLQFKNFKLTHNQELLNMKKKTQYYEYWGDIIAFTKQVEKILKGNAIDLVYVNSKKVLAQVIMSQSLKKPTFAAIKQCIINEKSAPSGNFFLNRSSLRKISASLFSIEQTSSIELKRNKAATKIQAYFKKYIIQKTFKKILHRRRVETRIKQWIHNGLIIKRYRKSLQQHIKQIHQKFEQQQKQFRINFPTIQSSKHFQIHIPNRQYMNGFQYIQQMSNVEVTRIFNLENSHTDLIYICPFQISVQTINYYFKIMELQEIQGYHDRVTFLELNGQEHKTNLPQNLNSSAKLYYNTKALKKLKKKVGDTPAYFVINQPTQNDVKLSVFLGIPIMSGNFPKINFMRSEISTEEFSDSLQTIQATPSLSVHPRSLTTLSLSNMLIRFCESNKQTNKFILKINNKHNSSGMALLSYPFTSLPEMYSCTALVQPYFYLSIEKFYNDLIMKGGIIQKYQQGIKTLTVAGKVLHDSSHVIVGTFQRISSGFINIGYSFPQKAISHKLLIDKCKGVITKIIQSGHFGSFQITVMIDAKDRITLEQIELFSTKITHSLSYFKFLAGGYFNNMGQFITKITGEEGEDEEIATMEARTFCYIPFILHFGLSQKQSTSFFQLCRIGGVSFDLQNKFGSTFILLGSMKNCIGVITSAKDKKVSSRLMTKTLQFLIKQNSHNISNEMLIEKENRLKDRFNIVAIKDRIENM